MEEEPPPTLKRRDNVRSTVVVPTNFDALKSTSSGHRLPPSSPSAATDFELIYFKSSPTYTSLKDLLPSSPAALLSPTPACLSSSTTTATSTSFGGTSGNEISIRNRLVKQAAWAYLQPMASSPSASGGHLWSFSGKPFFSSITRTLVDWAERACNCLADALWLLLCR